MLFKGRFLVTTSITTMRIWVLIIKCNNKKNAVIIIKKKMFFLRLCRNAHKHNLKKSSFHKNNVLEIYT